LMKEGVFHPNTWSGLLSWDRVEEPSLPQAFWDRRGWGGRVSGDGRKLPTSDEAPSCGGRGDGLRGCRDPPQECSRETFFRRGSGQKNKTSKKGHPLPGVTIPGHQGWVTVGRKHPVERDLKVDTR